MLGGAWFDPGSLGAGSEEALLSRATEAVRAHLHVDASPIWSHVRIQKVEAVPAVPLLRVSQRLMLVLVSSGLFTSVSPRTLPETG